MKLSESIKPVSYVKAHASEIIRKLSTEESNPVIITQNGEAKAVLVGVREYERMQESLALLKVLAMSSRDVEQGRVSPARDVFVRVREK